MNTHTPAEAEKQDILVVDDTPENITVLRDILVRAGYRVRPALNGALALRAVEAQCPDLVLLDIMMPGMDGYETCARLRAMPAAQDVPVLFISALDGAQDKLRAFAEGGVDYVAKPFHAAEVLARVQVQLRLRAARRQLARQNRELEAAARLRDDVDAILRHDLKSPLATMLAAAETLADHVPATGAAAAMTGYIREAGREMMEQIHRSLDLLKMERGVYPLQAGPVELHALARQVAAELMVGEGGRRATVRCAAEATETWWVEAEAMLCRSLLRNLLKNAVEASPAGAEVTVARARSEEERVVIVITNEGEVPAAMRERLFQKFATAGKAGGTGLGSYSARLMAETQGGAVRLAAAGAGRTVIEVELPRAKRAPGAAKTALTSPAQPGAGGPGARSLSAAGVRRVLVADDDPAHADAVARLLAGAGAEVTLAHGAAEAEAALARGGYDAALIDFEMPGGNGAQVARRHREGGGRARLVALTAHDDARVHAACLAAGFERVLVKPAGKVRLLAELAGGEGGAAAEAPAAEGMDPELAALAPAFLAARTGEVAALEAALAGGDAERVRALSHRLRGGFSIYGFAAAAQACARIEAASAAGDGKGAAAELATLTRTLEKLRLQGVAAN